LSELENKEFGDLCEMVGRFSADEEELKIPNMFFSEESILNKGILMLPLTISSGCPI